MEKVNKDFSDYLKKMRMLEGFKHNRTVSQSEMARKIGIPQGSLSQYENGTRLPEEENRHKLGNYFGPEVYEILNVPVLMPEDPLLSRLAYAWKKLSPDMQKMLVRNAEEAVDNWENTINNIAGDVKR